MADDRSPSAKSPSARDQAMPSAEVHSIACAGPAVSSAPLPPSSQRPPEMFDLAQVFGWLHTESGHRPPGLIRGGAKPTGDRVGLVVVRHPAGQQHLRGAVDADLHIFAVGGLRRIPRQEAERIPGQADGGRLVDRAEPAIAERQEDPRRTTASRPDTMSEKVGGSRYAAGATSVVQMPDAVRPTTVPCAPPTVTNIAPGAANPDGCTTGATTPSRPPPDWSRRRRSIRRRVAAGTAGRIACCHAPGVGLLVG